MKVLLGCSGWNYPDTPPSVCVSDEYPGQRE